ncbi:MAG: zinc-binding alcohol dehydrogenase [Caldilinea sp.]|nr:zinc-binding alcohol dehydrogenase [Caldilinea sp.]MDW8441337.1 zinc-binding alcohol dehydrogenase [Caldilineaceae bacterium]
MQTRAILFTAPNELTVGAVQIPAPGTGEALVEAIYTLISPGTELRCLAGKQEGAIFPFIPGYSFVGRVVARGEDVFIPEGTLVYCNGTGAADVNLTWGGHVGHAVRSERELYPLPDGVDPLNASAAHLAAIAYRGVRLSQPRSHETVAVIGLGAIGALAARLHALTGARVVAADLSPRRVAAARRAGIEAYPVEETLAATFARILPAGADVVVDATGAPAALPQAIEVARQKPWDDGADPGARIVIQGSYVDAFSIPYQPAFRRELTFFVPRDAQPRDLRAVLDFMARSALDVSGVIGDVRPPEAAAKTYAELAEPDAALITAAFQWARP